MIVPADAMHHWVLRCAFAGLALWLLFAAWAQHELRAGAPGPAAGAGEERRILVLYDERAPAKELEAALAGNLAGRFGRARFGSLARYRRGDLRAYDAAIVLPAGAVPESLAADVRRAERPVLWIGPGIEALFADPAYAAAQGWIPAPAAPADWVAVRYKQREFPRDLRAEAVAAVPRIADPARVAILASAVGRSAEETPWALRSGRLFYIAETPFAYAHEDDRYLVFADLLFEALAPETPERHRAMVRIDDVGPDSNPRRIRGLADLLAEEGVPFSMAVYDTYRDPGGRFSNGRPIALGLAQRPQIVAALRYAVSRGATLVAHGHTHQTDTRDNPHGRVSGGDFEFFAADLQDGAFVLRGPLAQNTVGYWRGRLDASARAWRRSGLGRPLLFTTPHHAASAEAYAAVREGHVARYERSLYFAGEVARGRADYARGWTSQFFPYEAVDLRGDFILPENLGLLGTASGRAPERVIAAAERNLAVRDGFASFYFPWYESPEALRSTVRGVKALGYRFVAPGEVVRAAPAHAAGALHRASPVASAAGAWARALPPLNLTLMVALLALVAAMWLAGETVLKWLPEGRRPAQRAAA
ncbi:MAG TPA: DUF2334 domain-containing protein [Allosphingosinicella sp.]|nr:DUF2334 domain-containing protein [Allosphingosinicella sp.]